MDGMGWDGSLGLVEYRAPYGANNVVPWCMGEINVDNDQLVTRLWPSDSRAANCCKKPPENWGPSWVAPSHYPENPQLGRWRYSVNPVQSCNYSWYKGGYKGDGQFCWEANPRLDLILPKLIKTLLSWIKSIQINRIITMWTKVLRIETSNVKCSQMFTICHLQPSLILKRRTSTEPKTHRHLREAII